MIRITLDLLVPDIQIRWTRQPSDNFLLVLAHYEPVMIKRILLNITYTADGLSLPFDTLLTGLPAVDGYVIQATNVSNLNEVWDQSEAFAIGDPNSTSTSATDGPATIFTTTTITAAASTSVDSSSISSAITTPSSPISQSISTLSSSSPTNTVSSTSSVPDTVTSSPTPSQAGDSGKSIPVGSIVGGTLGGLVLILLLIFALVFSRMRHKKKRLTDDEDFSVDPKASIVTPFSRVSLAHNLKPDSSSSRSHRNFPSSSESYDYTKPIAYGLDHAMDGVPRALTPGITSHRSQSSYSHTGLQPPKSSMHEAASISGISLGSSQPFTDPTGRPSTPSVPFTGYRPAQHSPHIPVLQLPVNHPQESAPAVPGPSTGASSNAPQQPRRPLLVVGDTSCDVDDDELPPPSYSSGILVASVREK